MNDSKIVMLLLLGLALSAILGCSKPTQTQFGSVQANLEQRDSPAKSDLGLMYFSFTEPRYGKAPERVPKDLEEAAPGLKVSDERIYAKVKNGDYVVRWGVPLSAPVIAYEKAAPSKGGLVLRGGGTVENMTAEQLNGLLGK